MNIMAHKFTFIIKIFEKSQEVGGLGNYEYNLT